MAAGVRDIKIRFSGDSSGLAKAATDGEKSVGRFSDRTQKFAKVALAGVAAVGVGLAAGLKAGVQGLQEGEEAEAKFNDALSRSSAGIQRKSDALKANAEEIQRNTRFTYEAALGASAFLASQDGVRRAVADEVVSIQDATNITLDLATVMGVDATTAAGVLSKALSAPEKATGALRKAGVTLTAAEQEKVKALVKSGEIADAQAIIMDKLKAKTEGAAFAAGQTTAGQMERAQNAFGEVQEQLAVGLLPVLTDLLGQLVKVTAWAQENPAKVKVVVIVLGTLAAVIGTISLAITAWNAIVRVATAVQATWNAVMAANPLVLITLAVIALIAVIVLIATRTTWFQDLWSAAWGGIKAVVSSVFNWVKSNWPLILAIITGPIGLAVLAVVKNFDRIKDAAGSVKDAIAKAFSTVADIITKPFEAAVRGIKSAWNSTIGGKGINIPKIDLGFTSIGGGGFTIPMLAKGGNITRGGLALVGEEGPELLNLGRGAQVTPLGGDGLGGDLVVELHARDGVTLEGLIEKVIVRRDRATRSAVIAGSRRAFA